MTIKSEIYNDLSYLTTEAYLAGLDDGKPLTFTPGNKTRGERPWITKSDGTVPSYLPVFKIGDSDRTVQRQITAMISVFHAFRTARKEGKQPLDVHVVGHVTYLG